MRYTISFENKSRPLTQIRHCAFYVAVAKHRSCALRPVRWKSLEVRILFNSETYYRLIREGKPIIIINDG